MAADDIQAIVRTIISSQVVAALNDAPDTIDKLVKAALSKPVDAAGNPERYGTGTPYLDWLVGNEIRAAAREALVKVLAERRNEIKAAVEQAFTSGDLVAPMVNAIIHAMTADYALRVTFTAEKRE